MFSASRDTVRAVLDELEQSRVIARKQGRGTFLRDTTLLLKDQDADKTAIEVVLPNTSISSIAQMAGGIRSASHRDGLTARIFDTGLSVAAQMQRLRELRMRGFCYPARAGSPYVV